MVSRITEIVKWYDDGIVTRLEMFERLFDVVFGHDTEGLDALSESLRVAFLDWAQRTFDNGLSADAFFSIKGQPDPEFPKTLSGYRSWLRSHAAGSG